MDIIPGNYLAYGLIEKYSGIFVDGMGGVNAAGIRLALEVEEIPKEIQNDLIRKIILFISTGIKTQRGN